MNGSDDIRTANLRQVHDLVREAEQWMGAQLGARGMGRSEAIVFFSHMLSMQLTRETDETFERVVNEMRVNTRALRTVLGKGRH